MGKVNRNGKKTIDVVMFVKENLFTTLKSNKEGTDAFYSESSLSHG